MTRRHHLILVAFLSLLGLGGCAGTLNNLGGASNFPQLNHFLDHVATMTLTDLHHADALALVRVHPEDGTPWPDDFAHTCFNDGLIPFVNQQQETLNAGGVANPDLTVVGAISAFQLARNGVKTGHELATTPIFPPYVVKACGPYVLDIINDVNAAGVKVGAGFLGLGS